MATAPAGDYTLLEKIFGQTSNNKERMKLKAEVLAKANIPTNPSLVSNKHRRCCSDIALFVILFLQPAVL